MKVLRTPTYFQSIIILLVILNCSSYLYTTNEETENTANTQDFTSCGKSIEYISDSYKNLETIFPIQKKNAKDYMVNKLTKIEEYFSRNIHVLEKDTVKIAIEYQSDSRVTISNLYQVKDSAIVTKDINSDIFASLPLDSNLLYSINVELTVTKQNNMAHAYIEDVNYSTVVVRSKANIMRTIMKNLSKMRDEYNRILRQYSGVRGKLTLKFIVDETGNIIYLKVVESSLNNCKLENNEVNIVKKCFFDSTVNKPNLTTVVYPFIFSQ